MPIQVTCSECSTAQSVGNEKAGLRLRCRNCGAVVAIPALEPGAAAKTGKTARPSPLAPLVRPVIYSLVGVFAVGALLFRWWFNPLRPVPPQLINVTDMNQTGKTPAAEPKPPSRKPPSRPVAPKQESAAPPKPAAAPEPENKLHAVLNEARLELVGNRNQTTSKFYSLLQGIASELPEIQLSTEPDQVVWNKFALYEHGVFLNAFRFTSPLDVPADFFWCFAYLQPAGSWYILPESGSMRGFRDYRYLRDVELEGLDLPRSSTVITQQLLGGQIQPKQTYIVYFNSQENKEIPFRVAARLLPTKNYYDDQSLAERILRRVGLAKLPKPVPTPGARVLPGHDGMILHLAWRSNDELASFDADGDIHLWDVAQAEQRAKIETGIKPYSAVVSPDGRQAVLLSRNPSRVTFWDLETQQMGIELPEHDGQPRAACFAADGKNLYVVYDEPANDRPLRMELALWSVETKEILDSRIEQSLDCRRLFLTPAGVRIVGATKSDERQTIPALADWPADLSARAILETSPGILTMGACRVQNGALDLLVDFYGALKFYETNEDHKFAGGSAIPNFVHNVCALADDRYAAIACYDDVIMLFDTVERQVCMTWVGHEDSVMQISVSPDGKILASGSRDNTIRLWDPAQRSDPETPHPKTLTDSQGHELKLIPAGEFVMGSSPNIDYPHYYQAMTDFLKTEQPQHRVRFSRPYYAATREVTVGQFRRFVDATGHKTTVEANGVGGALFDVDAMTEVEKPEHIWLHPGFPQTENHPVVQITWDDAQAYCAWLSKVENAKYRLLTEAEWEFACGADPKTQRCFTQTFIHEQCCNSADDTLQKVYGDKYNTGSDWNDGHAFTAEAGTYYRNKFGLSEMLGNVWELCEDSWRDHYDAPDAVAVDPVFRDDGQGHVCRGTGFLTNNLDTRACRRDYANPKEARADIGFRVMREVSPP